jgi:hypothetical protein
MASSIVNQRQHLFAAICIIATIIILIIIIIVCRCYSSLFNISLLSRNLSSATLQRMQLGSVKRNHFVKCRQINHIGKRSVQLVTQCFDMLTRNSRIGASSDVFVRFVGIIIIIAARRRKSKRIRRHQHHRRIECITSLIIIAKVTRQTILIVAQRDRSPVASQQSDHLRHAHDSCQMQCSETFLLLFVRQRAAPQQKLHQRQRVRRGHGEHERRGAIDVGRVHRTSQSVDEILDNRQMARHARVMQRVPSGQVHQTAGRRRRVQRSTSRRPRCL